MRPDASMRPLIDTHGQSWLAVAALIGLCACAESTRPTPAPQATPPVSVAAVPSTRSETVSVSEPDGAAIPLARLIAIARQHTPSRAIWEARVAAARAAALQAGTWANPSLDLEGGMSSSSTGSRVLVGRAAVAQRFEWPDKRNSRVDAAQAGVRVAQEESVALERELDVAVRQQAVELAAAEAERTQAQQEAAFATTISQVIDQRLAAGEVDRGEHLRAELDRRQALLAVDTSDTLIAAARASLRALCGGTVPEHFTVPDALDVGGVPPLADVLAASDDHPRLQVRRAQVAQRRAELAREHAVTHPDVTVGVFTGQVVEGTEAGLTLGLDLPLWDRNQGGIAAAQAGIAGSDAELANEMRIVRLEVEAAWRAATAATTRLDRLTTDLQPLATSAVDLRLAAFEAGEIGLAEVLDAKRAAGAIANARVAAQAEAVRARIRLASAIGRFASVAPRHPETAP